MINLSQIPTSHAMSVRAILHDEHTYLCRTWLCNLTTFAAPHSRERRGHIKDNTDSALKKALGSGDNWQAKQKTKPD